MRSRSVFGGVHVNPNVDVFAGGTYSTQESYRDGTGYEVANTGNRLSAGLAKLTVRPADGHEVKLGTIFQEDLYSVGQPPRRAGDPNSTNPNGANSLGGTSIYKTDVKNYTTTLGWKYSKPEDKLFDWDAKVYWNRTENDQIKTAHTSTTRSPPICGRRARQCGLRLHRQQPRLPARHHSVSTSTTRRVSRPGNPGVTRSPMAWMPSRTR